MAILWWLTGILVVHFFSWFNIWILIFPKGEFQFLNKCLMLQRCKWFNINKSRWRGTLLCKGMGAMYCFIWYINMAFFSSLHFWLLKVNLNRLSSLTMHNSFYLCFHLYDVIKTILHIVYISEQFIKICGMVAL